MGRKSNFSERYKRDAVAKSEASGDFTPDERIQFGIPDNEPTCPQFAPGYEPPTPTSTTTP